MKALFLTFLFLVFFSFSNAFSQKSLLRLPTDSVYKNKSGKTMWVLSSAALDTFTVNLIQNRSCKRMRDSLQVQVQLLSDRKQLCDSALAIRAHEASVWHAKLDSTDMKLQKTEISLEKEKKSKSNWVKATLVSAGSAVVFLITTIIFIAK